MKLTKPILLMMTAILAITMCAWMVSAGAPPLTDVSADAHNITIAAPTNNTFVSQDNDTLEFVYNWTNESLIEFNDNDAGNSTAHFANCSIYNVTDWGLWNITENIPVNTTTTISMINVTLISGQAYLWQISCNATNDTVGNNGTNISSRIYTFTFDNLAPLTTLVSTSVNGTGTTLSVDTWTSGVTYVNATANDTTSGVNNATVYYQLYNSTWASGWTQMYNTSLTGSGAAGTAIPFNASISTSSYKSGLYNISFKANDTITDGYGADNQNATVNFSIRFDNTVPTITFNSLYNNATSAAFSALTTAGVEDNLGLNISISDADSGVDNTSVIWRIYNISSSANVTSWVSLRNVTNNTAGSLDGEDYNFTGGFNTATLPDGNYTIAFQCNDTILNGTNNTNFHVTGNQSFLINNDDPLEPGKIYKFIGNINGTGNDTSGGRGELFVTFNCSARDDPFNVSTIANVSMIANWSDVFNTTSSNFTQSGAENEYNLSIALDFDGDKNNATRPGVHYVKFYISDTLGHLNNSASWHTYTVTRVNATEVESLVSIANGATATLNILYENNTEVNDAADLSQKNYTYVLNVTNQTADGRNVSIVGIGATNLNYSLIANMNKIHDINITSTSAINASITDVYPTLSNRTIVWVNLSTDFLKDSSYYKYGKFEFAKNYSEAFYCNGTYAVPTCYNISECTAAVNYSSGADNSIIPANSGCFRRENGVTVIYTDTFSGAAVADDNTAPVITHSCDATGTYKGGAITCTCSANDNVDGDIDATNITYTVHPSTSSVGTFTTTCTAHDREDNTATDTITYTVRSTSGTSSSAGAGGGGAGTPATTAAATTTQTITTAKADTAAKVAITSADISVTEVAITPTEDVANVKVSVESLAAKPAATPAPTGKVYQYLKVEATNVEGKIKTGEITFKVPVSWINSNNLDKAKVVLNRYADNKWSALATTIAKEGATEITYTATTSGFSYFAVTGEEKAAEGAEGAAEGGEEAAPAATPTAEGASYWYWVIAIIVVIAAGIGYYFYGKKKK